MMNLKRTASHVAVALLTFTVGITLAALWLPQRRAERLLQSPAAVVNANSILQNQASKSDTLLKEIEFPRVWSETLTVAGKVEIVESDFLTWKVSLNGKEILSSDEDGSLPPDVLKHVKSRVAPFDEVVVLSQMDGTCCELMRFWFLGLKADGAYFLSKAIGDGFVHVPEVIVEDDNVRVKIRSGYGRHDVGFMRGGTWMLRNGRVTKQR